MAMEGFSMRKFFSLISTLFLFVFGFVLCKPIIDTLPMVRFANSNGNVDKHTATKADSAVSESIFSVFLNHRKGDYSYA